MQLSKKIAASILIVLALGKCSLQPQLHIFAKGISPDDVASLSSRLERLNLSIRPSLMPVPPSITRHTVIYPALIQDFALIETIQATLENAGFDNPRLIPESEANHSFTPGNIGVYLVNPRVAFESKDKEVKHDPYSLGGENATELTYNYFSECGEGSEAQSELNLYPAGTAILELFLWDNETKKEYSVLLNGDWQVDSGAVTVNLVNEGALSFSISEYAGTNWQGPYQGLTLVLEESTVNLEHCDYTHLKYR